MFGHSEDFLGTTLINRPLVLGPLVGLVLGDLNQGIIIDGFGGVTIGEGVRIAAYCVINTADHDFSDTTRMICDQGFVVAGVVIEDDVWLGTGVIVNKGVTIGRGSVIGAGSVVTNDIPAYSIAVGVPCRVVRSRR